MKTYPVQFSSVTQSCLTLCNPMNSSTPGLPVYHQLLEFTQTHVHWVSDAIQPSHPLLSPTPPALNLSQHIRKTLMIAKTVFPSMSKGTKTTLDDVQGIHEIMYVKVLWKLQIVLHIWGVAMSVVSIPPRAWEQRALKRGHRPDKQPIPQTTAFVPQCP